MTYTISKDFHFSAAHVLDGLEEGHQCSRLHGHNYIVRVTLANNIIDERGFVIDYGNLKPIKEFIDTYWDHRFLAASKDQVDRYDLPEDEYCMLGVQSSAENMARWLFEKFISDFPELSSISISETPKTWATYD